MQCVCVCSITILLLCSGVLDDMEYACYCRWFDHIVQSNPPKVDLIGKYAAAERRGEGGREMIVRSHNL